MDEAKYWRERLDLDSLLHQEKFATETYLNAERERPSMLFRPRLFIDGNQWCALYGDDIQNGVAGFGSSPKKAYEDFDRAWREDLGQKNET